MKLKSTFKLLMVSLLSIYSVAIEAQTTITIGNGTTSTWLYGPIYRSSTTSSFDYNRSAYIYTNAELNLPPGAVIQKLEWFKNSIDTFSSATYSYFDIWMENTTSTVATSTPWVDVTATATRVLQDSFNLTKNIRSSVGWNEFTITPFTYTGSSLQIAVDFDCFNVPGSPSTGAFTWLNEAQPVSRTFYGNGSSQPTTLNLTNVNRPNIRITYTYTPPVVDAGLDAITAPSAVSCVGTESVDVTLRNFGLNTLTSAMINWSIDGVAQTPNSWTGSLVTDATASVNLGNVAIVAGTTKDLKIWVTSPNGATDGAAFNDTLEMTLLAGMNGEFTVGGSGTPDYATLTAALADVQTNGACGDIRLLIYEGTYDTNYVVGNIAGLGSGTTLEIVSHPSNTTLPILQYSADIVANNFVFQFNNAESVILDSLDMRATNVARARVIEFANNNNKISITNCKLTGRNVTSTSNAYSVIYCNTSSSLDENITIENNTILNGSYGVYIYGGSSAVEEGNRILNNTVDSFYFYGIYTYFQQDVEISGNFVRDNNAYTSPEGIYLNNCYSAKVNKNTVLVGGSSAPTGIYLTSNDATAANPTLVTNNMVTMYSSATGVVNGMEVFSSENMYAANNTVAVYGGSSSSRAMYLLAFSASDSLKAYNNVLANFGGGYAIYATTSNAGIVDNNYNSYYSSGSDLAFWGTSQATLSDLQTASGFDANSIAVEPLFTSTTDLRTTTPDLDGAAVVLSYVSDDIDGDARDATTPDIGADEFTPPPVDAGIVSMIGGSFCAGTINTDVVLLNFATDTLKTVNIIRQVSVNGGAFISLDTLAWTGLLATGESATVGLGSYLIGVDTYTFKFYTTKPNTFKDPNNSNDTLTTNPLQAAMEGIYTVGGASPDYATFALLGADLATKGMCGAVVIDVREGTYNEQILVGPISGLSAMHTLTVRSDAANTAMPVITFEGTLSDNYVVSFLGVSHVTIDGLEIRTTGTTYSRVITMEQGVSDINITNCKIVGMPNAASTSTFRAAVFMNSTGANKRVLFQNNEILHGGSGIYSVQSSSNKGDSLILINNRIDSFYFYGIYSTYTDNLIIRENYIADDNSYTSPRGINALYSIPMEITSNEVYIGGSSAPNGMNLDFNDGTATAPIIISNNMISMYSTSASGTVTGMEVFNSEHNIVANNSIAVYGGGTVSRALYLFASGAGDSTYAYNNALANYGGNYALYAGTSTAIKASDYNSLYSTGANVGYWNAAAQATLADMQAASGFDANSVTADPVFISSMNLRSKGSGINNVATPLSYVTTDLDGDLRDPTTPDIGADEFTPPADDIAIVEILNEIGRCAVTAQEIRVVITNLGTNPQNAVSVELNITGALTQTLSGSSTGFLATGDVDTVSLGFFSTANGGIFNFTSFVNLAGDEDLNNDTVTLLGVEVNALPMEPTVSDVTVCIADASSVVLEASGTANGYTWFESASAATILSTDATYTASLTSTDTFYVRGEYEQSISVGAPDNVFGAGGNFTSGTPGLVFDVFEQVVIDSVTVYTNGAGDVVVNIEDASGNLLHTNTTVVTTSGFQRIAVGATVSPGTGYLMVADGSNAGLYRNSSGASFPYTEPSGSITIVDGTLSGFYYFFYDWAVTVTGCSSPLARVIVNVDDTPQPTIANDTICQGEDVSLNITSLTNQVTWYDDAAATTPIAYGSSYVATNVDSTTSYYITDLGANGCTSLVKEVKVVVKATPDAPVTADTAICTGESVMLLAMGTTGTINWYANANGGSSIAMSNSFTTPNLNSTKVYYVSEMIDGCEGPREDVIVTVNAEPNAPRVNMVAALCAGESATLMATTGANVMWYNSAMDAVVGTGNSYMTGALTANDTFYAVDMFNGCSSDATEVVITVNAVPAAPVSAGVSICAGNTAMLTATSTGTNTWYTPDDMVLFTGDMFTTPVLSETTAYYVVAENGNCESTKTWVTVAVAPNVDADKTVTVCEGEEVTLSLASDMMYNWYAGSSTTDVLLSGAMYTVTATTTDTFYAQAVGGNCTDARTMYIVNVDEAAALTAVGGTTICEGETAELTATASGTINWYATATSRTLLGTGATFTTPVLNGTSIYYAQAFNGVCVSDRLPAIITVNPAPSADFIAEDHGNRVFVRALETSGAFAHTFEIGDTTFSSASGYVDGNTVGTITVTYTIVNTITGCTSTSTADVNVSVASVKELSKLEIGLYPNPNSGSFTIDLPMQNEVYTLEMSNITGQVVYSNANLTSDANTINVNVPVGVYFVKVSDNKTTATIKVVVR